MIVLPCNLKQASAYVVDCRQNCIPYVDFTKRKAVIPCARLSCIYAQGCPRCACRVARLSQVRQCDSRANFLGSPMVQRLSILEAAVH